MTGTLRVLQPFTDFNALAAGGMWMISPNHAEYLTGTGYTFAVNGSFSDMSGTATEWSFSYGMDNSLVWGDYSVNYDVLLMQLLHFHDMAVVTEEILRGMDVLDYSAGGVQTVVSLKDNTTIIGNDLGDTITISHSGVTLQAGDGDDSITGSANADRIDSGLGDDTIDGGDSAEGTDDVAVYTANAWTDFDITYDSETSTYTIASRGSVPGGSDTLTNVELFEFSNGQFSAGAAVDVGPDAADDTSAATLIEDSTGFKTTSGTLLGNDSDANASLGDSFLVTGIGAGAVGTLTSVAASGDTVIAGKYGTLTVTADGSYSYTLDNTDLDTQALGGGATAQEVFAYRIADLKGATDNALLTLTVTGSNDAPIALGDALTGVTEDVAKIFTAGQLLGNDTDIDNGDTKLIASVTATAQTHGTVTLLSNGRVKYTPDANYAGAASFTYTTKDAAGSISNSATASFAVAAVNDAPKISSDGGTSNGAVRVYENTKAVTTVTSTDVDGSARTYSIVSGEDSALFKINATTGALSFVAAPDVETPKDLGKNNVYNVTVMVSDGTLADTQKLAITVKNVNGNAISGTSLGDRIDTTHKLDGLGATEEADKISGKGGDDTIRGAGGDDTLKGGAGKDALYGEAGKDQFVFDAKPGSSNVDTIKDFVHNEDLLALDNAIFTKIVGQLDKGELYVKAGATAAHDSDDRVIYDRNTGKLYYDDDGKGGHAAVHFATLSSKPALDHGDFVIV